MTSGVSENSENLRSLETGEVDTRKDHSKKLRQLYPTVQYESISQALKTHREFRGHKFEFVDKGIQKIKEIKKTKPRRLNDEWISKETGERLLLDRHVDKLILKFKRSLPEVIKRCIRKKGSYWGHEFEKVPSVED